MKYDHKKFEKHWQKIWEKTKLYLTRDEVKGKENFYALVEFPYPSGNLHVGHWYAFSAPDIFARMRRMQGKNVLFPIGFDAFGLPAENAALKRGKNPRRWTYENIDYMRRQLRTMGASFDWSREVITCDPEYYKWTQWIFLQFFKKGLAYQAETPVNWCPSCKTVLANEQVIGGQCERCDSLVERRKMKQWQLKITDYAEKLLNGLEKLDWPEEIKESQRNWIGRSEGALIKFQIPDSRFQIPVFTTRPDTIFGATYIVLAPEHPIIENFQFSIFNFQEVKEYIEKTKRKTELQRQAEEKEKTGVELKGVKAINPATKEEIPIWVADYVLPGYGTGAIMAVPAHDERDFEFATKFKLPIKHVVAPLFISTGGPDAIRRDKPTVHRKVIYALIKHWKEEKYLCLDWKKYGWHTGIIGGVENNEDPIKAAKREIQEETGYKNLRLLRRFTNEIHSNFFARHKDENRYAIGTGLFFQLVDGTRSKIYPEHTKNHKPVWIEEKNLSSFVNLPQFQYLWSLILKGKDCFIEEGLSINSGPISGLVTKEAKRKIIQWLEKQKIGTGQTQYKLRDWLISRQRYWGSPIPIIHCSSCGVQPVPEKELPVKLPEVKDYKPRVDGKSPLAKEVKWVRVKCPRCKGNAERETDTMDTFIDSSWYFLRYTDPKNKKEFASKTKMRKWMPVDRYSGGAEHTTMHLLYSRFWIKAMYDLGLVEWDEPYLLRLNRGLILGPDGQKMSKSRGNVVDPDEYVRLLGADTVRMYLAFIGPYNEVGAYPWNPKGILGIRRFLERTWNLFMSSSHRPSTRLRNGQASSGTKLFPERSGSGVEGLLHKTIKKVTEDIEAFKFNTAISAMMVLLNEFSTRLPAPDAAGLSGQASSNNISKNQMETFLKLLAPFAPHLAEELWHQLGNKKSIHLEKWPKYDPKLAKDELVTIAVQVNGKLRATVQAAADATEADVKELAEKDEKVKRYLEGKEVKKVIFVKGKILNLVVV